MKKRSFTHPVLLLAIGIALSVTLVMRFVGQTVSETGEVLASPLSFFLPGSKLSANSWNQVATPTQHWLLDIAMIDAENGWAVGMDGTIFRYRDGVWRQANSPTTSDLVTLALFNRGEGMAVGNQPVTFLENKGDNWLVIEDPVKEHDLYYRLQPVNSNPIRIGGIYDIALLGSDQIVAAGGTLGRDEFAALIRVDESNQLVPLLDPKQPFSLLGISLAEDGSGWAVGDGVVLAIEKGAIVDKAAKPESIDATLTAVSLLETGEAWAVGTRGKLAHFENGHWRLIETPWSDVDFYDIAMVNDKEGWAVGSRGTILHYNKGNWLLHSQQHPVEALVTPLFLTAVHMISANEGWIAGSNGTILRYQR